MLDFAVLYSLKCQSLLPPFHDFQSDDRLIARILFRERRAYGTIPLAQLSRGSFTRFLQPGPDYPCAS
jgi:hypothetical protein